jgi:hypothetical protein
LAPPLIAQLLAIKRLALALSALMEALEAGEAAGMDSLLGLVGCVRHAPAHDIVS